MVFLYILSAVFILIFIAMMISLRVTIRYGSNSDVRIGALFFDFNITNTKKNKYNCKKNKKATKHTKKQSGNKSSLLSEFTEGLEITDFLQLLRTLVARLVECSSGHVRVKIKKMEITVADKEPATAAVLYGCINAAVSWLVEYLTINTKLYPLSKCSIYVNCDFDKMNTEAEIELRAKIRIVHLSKFALKFFIDFIKLKETKNNSSLKGTK